MDTFSVKGFFANDVQNQLSLNLPEAKYFKIGDVKNKEEILKTQNLISYAVKRSRQSNKILHTIPGIPAPNYEFTKLPQTLQNIYSNHPFPLSQGPVLPLNCAVEDNPGTAKNILNSKTIFTHQEKQMCGEWIPNKSGISAWQGIDRCENRLGQQQETYVVNDSTSKIVGAATSKDTLKILYTCQLEKCIIHCPCSICSDGRPDCELKCRTKPCNTCNRQCTEHELKLFRLFNVKTDHFTMVTDNIDKYRFATPHPGIPVNCESCSKDVLEHQVLHLVLHMRCKFCRIDFRPFKNRLSLNKRQLAKSDESLMKQDGRTCSHCFKICKNKKMMEKHEYNVHLTTEMKHKCDQCNRSYLNRNALHYHKTAKHQLEKYSCEQCDLEFSSKRYLERHQDIKHNEEIVNYENICKLCGESFAFDTAMTRHLKEYHYRTNINLDYCKMEHLKFLCDQCDETFKRKAHLMRHKETIHQKQDHLKTYQCSSCKQFFSRRDNLVRHNLRKHAKDNEKNAYQCAQCDEQFSRKDNLRRHISRKH